MPLLPQVAMPLVRLFYKFWLDQGVQKEVLDETLGIDIEKDGGKKFGISSEQLAVLHQAVAESTGNPLIGVKLGQYMAGTEHALSMIFMKAATLSQGVEALIVNSGVASEAGRFEMQPQGAYRRLRFVHYDSVPFTPYQYDMVHAAVIVWLMSVYPDERDRFIFCCDASVADAAQYREAMGCQVRADEVASVLIDEELLQQPNPCADEVIYRQSIREIQKVLAKRMERLELYEQVRTALQECLMKRSASQEDVANQLNLSVRNLQRRLKEAGTSYQTILDDSREALALSLIKDENIPLYEIAFLVGYTEPSAFYKAFKRWTGKRPGDYRQSVFGKPEVSEA